MRWALVGGLLGFFFGGAFVWYPLSLLWRKPIPIALQLILVTAIALPLALIAIRETRKPWVGLKEGLLAGFALSIFPTWLLMTALVVWVVGHHVSFL